MKLSILYIDVPLISLPHTPGSKSFNGQLNRNHEFESQQFYSIICLGRGYFVPLYCCSSYNFDWMSSHIYVEFDHNFVISIYKKSLKGKFVFFFKYFHRKCNPLQKYTSGVRGGLCNPSYWDG